MVRVASWHYLQSHNPATKTAKYNSIIIIYNNALRMAGRQKRGRPRLRWEDCVEIWREREGRMRARGGGMETGGGDGNETGSVTKEGNN